MGTSSRKLIKMDIEEVIELLNKAYADEWLAYYQYWLGAKVIKGPMKESVIPELLEHADDELRHAEMIADRIINLGGTPVLTPKEWYNFANCGYESPDNPYVGIILEQNIKGEQCAIDVYRRLMEITKDKDEVTYEIALDILQDEVDHEDDLESLQEDLQMMLGNKQE